MINQELFNNFYTTERHGYGLSDDGGPFGFDIHMALEVCYLIKMYGCDCIVETGTNTGDTTEFLAKCFPKIDIVTCEVDGQLYEIAKKRLGRYSNVTVERMSSNELVANKINAEFPFYFLDAHWGDYWPLADELSHIHKGVVCVDDFDIHHSEYGYDEYNGVKNDIDLLRKYVKANCYVNNPDARYPYPLLQRRRLGGRAYYVLGREEDYLKQCERFKLFSGVNIDIAYD